MVVAPMVLDAKANNEDARIIRCFQGTERMLYDLLLPLLLQVVFVVGVGLPTTKETLKTMNIMVDDSPLSISSNEVTAPCIHLLPRVVLLNQGHMLITHIASSTEMNIKQASCNLSHLSTILTNQFHLFTTIIAASMV
jgi:hypothetical protein